MPLPGHLCTPFLAAASLSISPPGITQGGVPLFALDYAPAAAGRRGPALVAVADEEGFVTVADTLRIGNAAAHDSSAVVYQLEAHNNAVFDVRWSADGERLLTASGDQTIREWDTERMACRGECRGHLGSVKCVATSPTTPHIIASGSRDGSLRLWDLRCHRSVRQVTDATNSVHAHVFHAARSREDAHMNLDKAPRRRPRMGRSKQSVTAVVISKEGETVITGGASDGVVKVWDLRGMREPVASVDCHGAHGNGGAGAVTSSPARGSRTHGITSIALDRYGTSVAASCVDSTIYVIDLLSLGRADAAGGDCGTTNGAAAGGEIVRRLTGHSTNNFYIKCDFSADGSRVLSGSADGCAYIWDVSRCIPESCDSRPLRLHGHEGDVTGVRWSPLDAGTVATIADDFTLRVWASRFRDSDATDLAGSGGGAHASSSLGRHVPRRTSQHRIFSEGPRAISASSAPTTGPVAAVSGSGGAVRCDGVQAHPGEVSSPWAQWLRSHMRDRNHDVLMGLYRMSMSSDADGKRAQTVPENGAVENDPAAALYLGGGQQREASLRMAERQPLAQIDTNTLGEGGTGRSDGDGPGASCGGATDTATDTAAGTIQANDNVDDAERGPAFHESAVAVAQPHNVSEEEPDNRKRRRTIVDYFGR